MPVTLLCLALSYTAIDGTPVERTVCLEAELVSSTHDWVQCDASVAPDEAVTLTCESRDVPEGCDATGPRRATCGPVRGVSATAYVDGGTAR